MKFSFNLLILLLIIAPHLSLTDPSILISPTIIPSIKQTTVGHQVPNGFGPKLIQNTRIFKTFPNCGCMAHLPSNCPPCTSSPTNEIYRQIVLLSQCDCAPKMNCDPCPRLYQAVHEMSLRQVFLCLK